MTPTRTLAVTATAVVATLVVATGSASVAAKLVTSKDIKNGTIVAADVKDGSLGRTDLRPGTTVDTVVPRKRVTATPGATVDDARLAAPRVVLFRKGALTVYAKCFTSTGTATTHGEVYLATSVNGVVLDSRSDTLDGGPAAASFLNAGTDETASTLEQDSTGANDASMDSEDNSDFTAFSPDGTTLRGWTGMAVKNGSLAGGNGVYGAGDVCLFTGTITSN